MKPEQVRNLYDRTYAEAYDEKFVHSVIDKIRTADGVKHLTEFLGPAEAGKRWLDLGCGTGHFLSQFPDHQRAGLDVSPSMLALAQAKNPGVTFTEGSFTDPQPAWNGAWDVISCMWYAYGLVDSLDQIHSLLQNIARWLKPGGIAYIPFGDPELISGAPLPDQIQHPQGIVQIDGVIWSFIEPEEGKEHVHQLAPTLDWFRRKTAPLFESMELRQFAKPEPGVLEAIDPDWAAAYTPEQVMILRKSHG